MLYISIVIMRRAVCVIHQYVCDVKRCLVLYISMFVM